MALGPDEWRTALAHFGRRIELRRSLLDELNVFPVADADTGANLLATAGSVATAADAGATAAEVSAAVTKAALLGARGNSGVILSQWLAGFGSRFADPLDGPGLADALDAAADAAVGAVARPAPGTMLTVARDLADAALLVVQGERPDALTVAAVAHRAGLASVERTPDLLPVLADAGVVDAGGLGLTELLAAVVEALGGRVGDEGWGCGSAPSVHAPAGAEPLGAQAVGYEITFVVPTDRSGADDLRRRLELLGDSVAVAWDSGTARAHVHCDDDAPALRQIGEWQGVDDLRVEPLLVR